MFGKKLKALIDSPKHIGTLEEREGMRLATGLSMGLSQDTGRILKLFLLVDLADGVIADAKIQVFCPPVLLGAAEGACTLVLRKNILQARRITAELLDKHLECTLSPQDSNFILETIEQATDTCMDISVIEGYSAPPISNDQGESQIYPHWETLPTAQKLAIIEEVISSEIRPYVELDAGGVQVKNLLHNEVIIAYSGTCTTCYSATGSTLSAIQEILRRKIHPDLVVTPDLSREIPQK